MRFIFQYLYPTLYQKKEKSHLRFKKPVNHQNKFSYKRDQKCREHERHFHNPASKHIGCFWTKKIFLVFCWANNGSICYAYWESKNKLPITDGDDEKGNLEAIPVLSSIGKSRSPVPNADSASVSSRVLCQESLSQPHLTSTPDNATKSKVLPLVATKMSGSEQVKSPSSVKPTQEKPLKKETLVGMKTNINAKVQQSLKGCTTLSEYGDLLKTSTPTPIETLSNLKKDNLTAKSNAELEKESKSAETTNNTCGTNCGEKPTFGKDKGPLTNLHTNFHPHSPALTSQMEGLRVEGRNAQPASILAFYWENIGPRKKCWDSVGPIMVQYCMLAGWCFT